MRDHRTGYDRYATDRCERVLLTLLGDVGPWSERIYLAGGLAPRYLVGRLPDGMGAHVGTTDVDLIVGLALGDEVPETYRTLHNNLKKAGFRQVEFSHSKTAMRTPTTSSLYSPTIPAAPPPLAALVLPARLPGTPKSPRPSTSSPHASPTPATTDPAPTHRS